MSGGTDKHMSEPMIITLTDFLLLFSVTVWYLEIPVKFVEFFKSYTGIVIVF